MDFSLLSPEVSPAFFGTLPELSIIWKFTKMTELLKTIHCQSATAYQLSIINYQLTTLVPKLSAEKYNQIKSGS